MTLIISILNGILPVIFYVLVGYFLAHANVFPRDKYQVLLTLTFNVFFPISTVYSLGRKEILSEDFLIIITYYIASLCTMLICVLITPLLFKTDRRFGFAHTCSCTLMQNLIVTGLPIVQGFYDPIEAEKYSFITVFAQFTSTIPICFFLFEYAKLREKSDPNFKVILKVIHSYSKIHLEHSQESDDCFNFYCTYIQCDQIKILPFTQITANLH
ncbi:Membrane_transport family protein [Hexamita inflata]|uniref:Membrane_transport family protein n=1 Tax=Hexamita inflata TaxID=28002 RepID=A0ABP1H358_9EUKA